MIPPNMVVWGQMMIFSQNKPTLLLQQDDKASQENTKKVTNLNVQQVPLKGNTLNLQHDLQVLQEKIKQVMNGEDVNALFPVNHNEKYLCLEDGKNLRRIGSQR